MNDVLTVTPKAAEKIQEALAQEGKADYGLRVVAQPGGCSCCGPTYALYPEKEGQPDDTVVEEGGVRFYIDPVSRELVQGATIDYIEHPEHGAGFLIQAPKAAHADADGGCGCGGSGNDNGESCCSS